LTFLKTDKALTLACLAVTLAVLGSPPVRADAVTEWNRKAGDIIVDAGMGPLPADRALAIVQTAVYEAVNAITRRYRFSMLSLEAGSRASAEAAIAAANRTVLVEFAPSQKAVIEAAYQAALSEVPDGAERREGITVGERAALEILARRADDGVSGGESYRPHTSPGVYVPTVIPEAPHWLTIKPWLMSVLLNSAPIRPLP
jgi:hypothetical protein